MGGFEQGLDARPAFEQVLLTRFNVRYVDDLNAPSIGTDPDWLARRFQLFERYCLPSVIAQSQQNFSWIIFFDDATPPEFAERARELSDLRARTHPVFCGALPIEKVRDAIKGVFTVEPDWLVTSRLDNDDALHVDFISTLQRVQRFEQAEVLNCPNGVILHGRNAYRRRDTSNAFIALAEPYIGFKSVFSILRHVYAKESYPVRQLDGPPMWLQVIHDSNISNRVRGWRTPLASVTPGFPLAMEQVAGADRETAAAILAENLTSAVLRFLRDTAVIVVRRVAKLFGVDLRRKATQPRKAAATPARP
jgi:hypothetical protein